MVIEPANDGFNYYIRKIVKRRLHPEDCEAACTKLIPPHKLAMLNTLERFEAAKVVMNNNVRGEYLNMKDFSDLDIRQVVISVI